MKGTRRLFRRGVVLAVVAVALAAGGVAYASIPDSSGVIHGCYITGTGQLRVYDSQSSTAKKCGSNEKPLNWNQTGPQGPAGPQGAAGPAGTGRVSGPGWTARAEGRHWPAGTRGSLRSQPRLLRHQHLYRRLRELAYRRGPQRPARWYLFGLRDRAQLWARRRIL